MFNFYSLEDLQRICVERLADYPNDVGDWSLNDWMTALTGEVGEAANICKKMRRGDFNGNAEMMDAIDMLADELGDIQCYLVLLAERAGVNLQHATRKKFNEISERVGSQLKL